MIVVIEIQYVPYIDGWYGESCDQKPVFVVMAIHYIPYTWWYIESYDQKNKRMVKKRLVLPFSSNSVFHTLSLKIIFPVPTPYSPPIIG